MRRLTLDDNLLPCAYVLKYNIENELRKVSAMSPEHYDMRVSRATGVTAVHVHGQQVCVRVCVIQ